MYCLIAKKQNKIDEILRFQHSFLHLRIVLLVMLSNVFWSFFPKFATQNISFLDILKIPKSNQLLSTHPDVHVKRSRLRSLAVAKWWEETKKNFVQWKQKTCSFVLRRRLGLDTSCWSPHREYSRRMAFDHRNLTMFAPVQVIACRERNSRNLVVCLSESENRPKSRSEKSKVRKMKKLGNVFVEGLLN